MEVTANNLIWFIGSNFKVVTNRNIYKPVLCCCGMDSQNTLGRAYRVASAVFLTGLSFLGCQSQRNYDGSYQRRSSSVPQRGIIDEFDSGGRGVFEATGDGRTISIIPLRRR